MMCKSLLTVAIVLLSIPCGWAADLPPAKYSEWTIEKDIFVPMRDGIHLDTDVWLPKGAAGKLPTILVSTPYDKDKIENQVGAGWVEFFVQHGYAVVVQNQRGRYFSEGQFKTYLEGTSTDGYDTVQWIVKQSWSNGKVGASGCSASSDVQWPIAASNPPGFAARVTVAGGEGIGSIPPGDETRGAFYRGGVPQIGFWAPWYGAQAASEQLLLPANSTQEERIRLRNSYSMIPSPGTLSGESALEHLPSKDVLRAENRVVTPFDNLITWTPADPKWSQTHLTGAGARPSSPALLVETWHDDSVMETARMFKHLQDQGVPNQYLIIGPGPHCTSASELWTSDLSAFAKRAASWGQAEIKVSDLQSSANMNLANLKFGDLDVGDARYGNEDRGYAKLYLRWLNHWLKDEQNHVTEMPRVQLYVMGKGWIFGDQWPLKEIQYINYYLDGDLSSLHRQGAGLLTTRRPKASGKATYIYDPASPTPSLRNALDQRPIEMRRDVLTFSTPVLEAPVTIVGPIDVVLYVSSSAKDTDFMVRLVDVYPDGKAIHLNDDAFRVRYREGFNRKVLMEKDGVYKITLSNMLTGIRFAKGHRVRLDISSSSFPQYERNLNTGGNNFDEAIGVVAENSVHHGARHPSHIVLPVLSD